MMEYSELMKNIVLTGMAGAGKSTIGVVLAKELGMDFIDTDILIQQLEKRLLQTILDTEGVDRFLAIEESVVSQLHVSNSIIATGGSVVYSDLAMHTLAAHGLIVYLSAPFDALLGRLSNVSTRGIVIKKGSTLKDVYIERIPLYEKYSACTIDCTTLDVARCVQEIATFYRSSK